MASPQKENGFTAIANEIMDALIAAKLSGQDFKIALLIIRKTYGFNKQEDAVSLSQMVNATGMIKVRCSQVVNRLELMKILTVTENINGIGKKYKFNKDFDTWQTVNKKCNRLEKVKGTVTKKRNPPLMKSVTTKDTLTKDILQKTSKAVFVLPDWIPKEPWEAYLDMRVKIRKSITEHGKELVVIKLRKIMNDHEGSPEDVLNQSILNSWAGVFPIKPEGGNGNGKRHAGIKAWLERDVPKEYVPESRPEESEEVRQQRLEKIRDFTQTLGSGGRINA